MIRDRKLLSNVEPHCGNVTIANGYDVEIRGIENLELFRKNKKDLFMLDFTSNMLSVQKATKDLDYLFVFSSDDMRFQNTKSGKTIAEGFSKDGHYVLDFLDNKQHVVHVAADHSALSSNSISFFGMQGWVILTLEPSNLLCPIRRHMIIKTVKRVL